MAWMIALVILLLCYVSIKRRIWIKKMTVRSEAMDAQVSPIGSPLADSLKELIGVAGGVYIAVNALFAFLKIGVPDKAMLFGIDFDPIAAISVFVAVVQPYFVSPRK